MDEMKYEKGGCAGSRGVEFQVSLLTVFLLNSLRKLSNWRLSTENKKAGKFDDVVLESTEGSVLLQAKHKGNNKKITLEDLFSTKTKNDDYSLAKYFLSYAEIKNKFNIKNVILCTNTEVQDNVLTFLTKQSISNESMLYFEGDNYTFYTFDDNILQPLKEKVKLYYEQNYQNKHFDESVISDDNLRGFLQHLQFCTNYPSDCELEKVIERLLCILNCSSSLYQQVSFLEIYAKIMDWYQQKVGTYLTETVANAIFSEIRSEKRWQVLEQYNVQFHQQVNLQETSQLVHFTAEGGHLLQELKIYKDLQGNRKTLYTVLSDVDDCKKVIEAFQLPKYTHLLMSVPDITRSYLISELCRSLRDLLKQYSYKSVILLAGNDFVQQVISNNINCDVIEDFVQFEHLSMDTQSRLLKQQNILFQGKEFSLEELLGTQTMEVYKNHVNSEILESLIRGKQLIVGSKVQPLSESIALCYVNRSFTRIKRENTLLNEETFSEDNIYDINEKIILIAGSAGAGKSTVLTKLANIIKDKNPHLWVIRIELNKYTRILKELLNKKTTTIGPLELLNSKESTKLTSDLQKCVFSMEKKVVLMLDGVDEISPDYTELIISLLTQCQQSDNFAKVFVTTRPHLTRELEKELQAEPFFFEPFTEQCQVDFLTNYWSHHLKLNAIQKEKCKEYAKTLLLKVCSLINLPRHGKNHFGAIPLQIKMLAEIFQESNNLKSSHYWDGCREFVGIDKEEPKLPEKNLMQLYEMFIEKKRQIFIEKENPGGYILANQTLNVEFDGCLAAHRKLAVDVILGEAQYEYFSYLQDSSQDLRDIETAILKIGIIQKIDNSFCFIHRTFAEYFVAECLLKELQLERQNSDFQISVMNNILMDYNFNVVRAFLNSFVRGTSSTSFNPFYKSITYNTVKSWFESELIHNLADEGFVNLLQLIFRCIYLKITDKESTNCIPSFTSWKQTIEKMTNFEENLVNLRNRFGDTPLHRAAEYGHLEVVKFLVQNEANMNAQTSQLFETPLHRAVELGHLSIIKYLVQQGADTEIADTVYRTPLSKAIVGAQVRITTYLLQDLLQKKGLENLDVLVLYLLAYFGDLNNLKTLLELGVNIDSQIENGNRWKVDMKRVGEFEVTGKQWDDYHLKRGLYFTTIINNGESLLFGAARGAKLDVIRYLVEQGADINHTDHEGNTALHLVSFKDYFASTVRLLLELGINPNIKNMYGWTPLHNSAGCGIFDILKLLVEFGVDLGIQDCRGRTPLCLALQKKHFDCAKLLVEHGGDAYALDNIGSSILHLAVLGTIPLDTLKFFLECGTNINITDNHGRTALHLAASRKNQLDTVKLFLEHGSDVTINDNEGQTVLHYAARGGDTHVVEYILELRVDVNVRDNNGRTPLFLAAGENVPDIVDLLLRLGADVNIVDDRGCTALFLAVQQGNLDNVKFLVEKGADVNIQNTTGCTPIFFLIPEESAYRNTCLDLWFESRRLASNSPLDLAEFLVRCGLNVNSRNNRGRTVLHLIASRGQYEIAEFLIKLGANVNVRDNVGQTPLHLAAKGKMLNLVELLVKRGADINYKDFQGNTAASLAEREGHSNIVKCLKKSIKRKLSQFMMNVLK